MVYNTCKELQKNAKMRISACINCPPFQWPLLHQCRPSTASPVMTDTMRNAGSPTTWICKRNPSNCSSLHLRKVIFIIVPLLTRETPLKLINLVRQTEDAGEPPWMPLLASKLIHELSYCTVCLLFSQEAGAENKFLAQDMVPQSPNGMEQKR